MRVRINLFQEELFPVSHDWLDAYKAFAIVAAGLLLLLIGISVLWFQDHRLVQEVTTLRAQEQFMKQRLLKLMAQPAKTEEDEQQIRQLSRLETDIRVKKLVLEVLVGQRIGNRQGFSEHFRKLAETHFPDLWLTQIHLMDGGRRMVFVGRTLDNGIIFDFVKNMTEKGVFKGREFQYFKMQKVAIVRPGTLPQTRFAFGDNLDTLMTAWEKDLDKEEQKSGSQAAPVEADRDQSQGPMDLFKTIADGVKGGE